MAYPEEEISVTHHEANDNGRDGLAIFGAMVLGALIGGIAALLLAPKSGRELRGEIGETATYTKQRAEELAEQMEAKYQDVKGRVEEHLSDHAEEVAEAAEEVADEVEEQTEEA